MSLLAQGGKTLPVIAKEVGTSLYAIRLLRKRQDTAALIASISLKLREQTAEAALRLGPKLADFCEAALKTGDARQVDGAWRAWLNSEKIRASINLEHLVPKMAPDTKVGLVIQIAPWAAPGPMGTKKIGDVVIGVDSTDHLNPLAGKIAQEIEEVHGQ